MVRIETEYTFEGPKGPATLGDLFGGRRQLIVQHVMFGADWDAACPGCTASVDELSGGVLTHLGSRDTAFVLVSRAPLAKLQAYAASRGWTVPWYSSEPAGARPVPAGARASDEPPRGRSADGDFNYDFGVTVDAGHPEYNYRPLPDAGRDGPAELPGVSCFLRDGEQIFHTYSTYARGTDQLGSSYSLLDLTALGRQEDWEEPKGRAPALHGADPTFTD